jgi:hypothetical protein
MTIKERASIHDWPKDIEAAPTLAIGKATSSSASARVNAGVILRRLTPQSGPHAGPENKAPPASSPALAKNSKGLLSCRIFTPAQPTDSVASTRDLRSGVLRSTMSGNQTLLLPLAGFSGNVW